MLHEQDRPSVHDGRRKAAAPPSAVTGRRSLAMFDTTYLAGLGDTVAGQSGLDWLQVGARLPLRRVPPASPRRRGRTWHSEVEVQAPDGRALGYLPPGDSEAVAEVIDAGLPATARVTALIPTRHRPRVHIRVEVEQPVAGGRHG